MTKLGLSTTRGRELPSLEAAFREAIQEARAVAGFVLIGTGEVTLSHRIDIADEGGKVLASVGFGDAISVRQ